MRAHTHTHTHTHTHLIHSLPFTSTQVTRKNRTSELDLNVSDSVIDIEDETSQDCPHTIASSALQLDANFNIREDFDDLLQYDSNRVEVSTEETTSPKADLTQFYHNRIALESDSLENSHPKAPQLTLVQRNFPMSVNTLLETTDVRKLVDTHSPSVGAIASASTNNHVHNLTQESFGVSDSVVCGDVCGEESLLDLVQDPSVELEMQEDNETQDAVDSDNFMSKEVLDLLQELRKEAASKEGSHSMFVKGMVRIGEIDSIVEDSLHFDFVEELLEAELKSHTRSSRIV